MEQIQVLLFLNLQFFTTSLQCVLMAAPAPLIKSSVLFVVTLDLLLWAILPVKVTDSKVTVLVDVEPSFPAAIPPPKPPLFPVIEQFEMVL